LPKFKKAALNKLNRILFFRETDQLKANQARQSVEDSKRLLSDKNFRNKQDRDRRLRELQSNNMKKFVDERKRQASRHEQETALSLKLVREEEEALLEENKKVNKYFC
jgi:phosphatidylinositol phospholipase C beta